MEEEGEGGKEEEEEKGGRGDRGGGEGEEGIRSALCASNYIGHIHSASLAIVHLGTDQPV